MSSGTRDISSFHIQPTRWSQITLPFIKTQSLYLKKIHRTVIIHECENWILSVEIRLRVFENRVLGKVSGTKRDVETGEWRKLHDDLHDL